MKKERQTIKLSDMVLNKGQLGWLPRNPRQWTKDDLESLIRSLEEDPDYMDDRPPLVTPCEGKYLVFAGNMRTTAEQKRKARKSLECVVYFPEDETDQQTIVRRAAKDNGSWGKYDWDILANEWDDLPLTDWGVPAWENESADEGKTDQKPEAKEDDFDETKDSITVRCKPGDVWQLGEHRLMCGDSIDLEQVKTLMGGGRS